MMLNRFARSCLFFIFFLAISTNADGQNSIELLPFSGVKVFSPGNMALTGRAFGAEVSFNINQRNRADEWIKKLKVTDISVSAGYRNLGQVSIRDSLLSKGFLGNVFTLSSRLNIQLFTVKQAEILLVTGIGLAYSSSSFFSDENPLVGSRINFAPQAGIRAQVPIVGGTSLLAGADIFHYSNAGIKVPNKGVNSLQLSIGVNQKLKTHNQKKAKTNVSPGIKGFFELGADIGRRGSWKSDAGNWKSGYYIGYNHRISPLISVKAGSDAVYYYTTFDGSTDRFQYYATSYESWRWGISAGLDLWLGELAVTGNYGYYLKYNSYYPVKGYWTAGLKYFTNSWLGFQAKVYAHQAQADFAAAGLIFRLKAF